MFCLNVQKLGQIEKLFSPNIPIFCTNAIFYPKHSTVWPNSTKDSPHAHNFGHIVGFLQVKMTIPKSQFFNVFLKRVIYGLIFNS